MKIAIGNDHAGVDMKNHVIKYLEQKGHTLINFGTDTTDSCDYPVYGKKVALAVANGECERGILICGTGIGISMAANKVPKIRAAVCSEPKRHSSQDFIMMQTSLLLAQELLTTIWPKRLWMNF